MTPPPRRQLLRRATITAATKPGLWDALVAFRKSHKIVTASEFSNVTVNNCLTEPYTAYGVTVEYYKVTT